MTIIVPNTKSIHVISPPELNSSNTYSNSQPPNKPESYSVFDEILSYKDEFKDEDES